MKQARGIVDCRLSIVDVKHSSIQNRKSKIENASESSVPLQLAERYLVGGVNSPVRAFRHIGGDPLLLTRARGAVVTAQHGQRFIDFIMGWGALILGHNHPAVLGAVRRALSRGTLLGLTHPAEVELARLIAEAVPSVEQVRFTTSGTEACMTAVKLARAHTGRSKLLTFDGCYHGHSDSLMARNSAGIPEATVQETITVPFNDIRAFEEAILRSGRELACVIIEPVAANMGVVSPEPGFLARIREQTSHHGILLIFDEVVTGFRLGYAGAQGRFGIQADLTTFGKIIGGGLPIGAVGGPARLMQRLAPEGDVYHGGTFAGHPLTMAAGIAALTALNTNPPYERLEALSQRLTDGLAASAKRCGMPIQVNRAGSMWTVFFSETAVGNYAQANATRRDRFATWAGALRRRGLLIPPSPFEALFLSTAHTEAQVERFLRASSAAFKSMG